MCIVYKLTNDRYNYYSAVSLKFIVYFGIACNCLCYHHIFYILILLGGELMLDIEKRISSVLSKFIISKLPESQLIIYIQITVPAEKWL